MNRIYIGLDNGGVIWLDSPDRFRTDVVSTTLVISTSEGITLSFAGGTWRWATVSAALADKLFGNRVERLDGSE